MTEFKKCPFCSCMFLTDADLSRHLEVFGRKDVVHLSRLRFEHGSAELELSVLHGGADRVVRNIEAVILEYLADCKKSGKKVCLVDFW